MGQGAQGEETSSGQKEGTEDRGGKHCKSLWIWKTDAAWIESFSSSKCKEKLDKHVVLSVSTAE